MELRHLRYFIAVAEELNFRRAAERLHISQPPLSVAIRDLEQRLGALLFDRTQKQIFLTDAGRLFLQHARQVMQQVGEAQSAVGRLARGEGGVARLGFTPSSKFVAFVPEAIHRFRRQYPHVTLSLVEMESAAQMQAVAERTLDLGICRNPSGRPVAGVQIARLCAHPLVLAVHTSNPLARRRQLTVADLRDEDFVCSRRGAHPGFLYQAVVDLCWAAGFTPRIAQEVGEVSTLIGLVASGLGVAIVPASLRCIAMKGVRYLPLAGRGTSVDLNLVSLRKDASAPVTRLRAMLVEAAARV